MARPLLGQQCGRAAALGFPGFGDVAQCHPPGPAASFQLWVIYAAQQRGLQLVLGQHQGGALLGLLQGRALAALQRVCGVRAWLRVAPRCVPKAAVKCCSTVHACGSAAAAESAWSRARAKPAAVSRAASLVLCRFREHECGSFTDVSPKLRAAVSDPYQNFGVYVYIWSIWAGAPTPSIRLKATELLRILIGLLG